MHLNFPDTGLKYASYIMECMQEVPVVMVTISPLLLYNFSRNRWTAVTMF